MFKFSLLHRDRRSAGLLGRGGRVRFIAFLAFIAAALPLLPHHVAHAQIFETVMLNALNFQNVVAGETEDILHTDALAAKFRIKRLTSLPGFTVLHFTLPSALTAGAKSLPITFGPTSAAWSNTDDPSTGTTFDPNQLLQLSIPAGGVVYVWIGGTITTTNMQPSGAYTETLTLTATNL